MVVIKIGNVTELSFETILEGKELFWLLRALVIY